MSGYIKNIAVIRGIKDGFSSDGGALSGLIKAERYAGRLKVEVSLINFAPLTDGRYITALYDGTTALIVEDCLYEGDSPLEIQSGFSALVCFVNGGVYPVASAICGNFRGEVFGIKAQVEKLLNVSAEQPKNSGSALSGEYEDEAIAEENYYEYEADEDGGSVRKDKDEEEKRQTAVENENDTRALEKEREVLNNAENGTYSGGNAQNGLAGGNFYEKMKPEIDGIFEKYPKERCLEELIENSRWVRISYNKDCFYVFGVIYSGGSAEYICYGVPSKNGDMPESMRGISSFIPVETDDFSGFWVMYQDAKTGASLKIEMS